MANIKLLKILRNQNTIIKTTLSQAGWGLLAGNSRQKVLRNQLVMKKFQAILASRLKKEIGIKAKMNRFGESRDKVLDIFGHRVVVSSMDELEMAVKIFKKLGDTPSKPEMLLRNGALQFPWLRDYRKKKHTGKSKLTASDYNEAVHMNRKIDGNICEIQIITQSLFNRAFISRAGAVAHAQFAKRRSKAFLK